MARTNIPGPLGYVLWEGPSLLTGDPIVAIMTVDTSNAKNLGMAQGWILRRDISPAQAVKSRKVLAVCSGRCIYRPKSSGGYGGCYVNIKAPQAIWKAYNGVSGKDGKLKPTKKGPAYAWGTPVQDMIERLDAGGIGYFSIKPGKAVPRAYHFDKWTGKKSPKRRFVREYERYGFRIGAYGDPSAVPYEVWEPFLQLLGPRTGYTAEWRTCDPRMRHLCMASVYSQEQAREANNMGWRGFHAVDPSLPIVPVEFHGRTVYLPEGYDPQDWRRCPAEILLKAGKIPLKKDGTPKSGALCIDCGMCSGDQSIEYLGRNILIHAHGAQVQQASKGIKASHYPSPGGTNPVTTNPAITPPKHATDFLSMAIRRACA